ncbi:MAG TPA: tetratricopeptide repeat protein [Bryobacteraceae bacterium]|jgi:tetratricopeptide (TPR) repeat protein
MLLFPLLAIALSASTTPESVILHIQDEIRAGDLVRAQADVSTALENDPKNGGLYNLRGIVHANRNELKDAAGDFERAARFSPGLEGARLNLEKALLALAHQAEDQHDLQGALGYLAQLRDLKPNDGSVHFFFGVVCIQLNLVVEAKKSLDRALQLAPANPWYNYARGSVELQGRAAWQAIPYFKKAIAASPDDPRARFALGVAEFASQDYEAAKKDLALVAGRKETAGGAQYILGRIAKAESDWNAATRHLAASIAAEPNYADSHAELGLARLHLGDIPAARQEIEQALRLDPNSYLANRDLLALYERTKDPLAAAQRQKLGQLESQRVERQDLMLRTIKVIR